MRRGPCRVSSLQRCRDAHRDRPGLRGCERGHHRTPGSLGHHAQRHGSCGTRRRYSARTRPDARGLPVLAGAGACSPCHDDPQQRTATVAPVAEARAPHPRAGVLCLVPVPWVSARPDGKANASRVWFTLDASLPLFAFAGIWRPWFGVRGPGAGIHGSKRAAQVPADHRPFSILTAEPNGLCADPQERRRRVTSPSA